MNNDQLNAVTNWFVAHNCEIRGTPGEGMAYTLLLPEAGTLELNTCHNRVYIHSGLGMPEDYAFEVTHPTPAMLDALLTCTQIGSEAAQVTDKDRHMVVYFLREMGDITRWCDWEQRKDTILMAYPSLATALEVQQRAAIMLENVLDKIEEDMS